jgi:hypothetical protein
MRYRNHNGQGWADIIDLLTMFPEAGLVQLSRPASSAIAVP